MKVSWLDPDNLDVHDLAEVVALLEGARRVDAPEAVGPTVSSYVPHLRHGWDGDPPLAALARDENRQAIGVLELHLPKWDNTHLGFVSVTVDPPLRRRGIGRELFQCGVDYVTRAAGRSLLLAECFKDSAGVPFLEGQGLRPASADVARRQKPRHLDWAALDAVYAEAEKLASDYDIVRIPVPTPDDLMPDILEVTQAINDAPRDDLEIEDDLITPERVRAFENAQLAQGKRIYRVAARHRGMSILGGHTMVGVEADRPWHAWQLDTSVVRAHRGHRLGLLLKTEMLRWLRDVEPQVRTLDTWNAASNAHMIAVNELLGYEVLHEGISWQRRL